MNPSADKQNAIKTARNSLEIEGIQVTDEVVKKAAQLSEEDCADGKAANDFKAFVKKTDEQKP